MSVTTKKDITKNSTMQEILESYPSAQRALFQRYHVGGCSSCGFQPSDTLEKVCANHNLLDIDEVIQYIQKSQEVDEKSQISAREVAELWNKKVVKLLDVRGENERALAKIEGVPTVDQELAQEIISNWPKDTPLVFHCHHGIRSLDAASYFIGHGFTNVKSMIGGIDAWSEEVDPTIPKY